MSRIQRTNCNKKSNFKKKKKNRDIIHINFLLSCQKKIKNINFALTLYMLHMGEYDLLFLLITTSKLQAPVQPSYEENIITAEYSHETMKKYETSTCFIEVIIIRDYVEKAFIQRPHPPLLHPASFFKNGVLGTRRITTL